MMSKSTSMLWAGWSAVLIGLLLPIINLPEGDPDIGSLMMFLGLRDDAYGWQVAIALIAAPLKHIGWVVFSLPLWLGLMAPAGLLIKSRVMNGLLALCYGVGFIVPITVLSFALNRDGLIDVGYYVWVIALFLLAISRLKVLL